LKYGKVSRKIIFMLLSSFSLNYRHIYFAVVRTPYIMVGNLSQKAAFFICIIIA